MTVIVTGADGFIGCSLVKILLQQNHSVLALTRRRRVSALPNLKAVEFDLLEPDSWHAACTQISERVSAVVHLAALMPGSKHSSEEYTRANTDFTGFLADWVKSAALADRKLPFIYSSSIGVMGFPLVGPIDEKCKPAAGRGALDPYFESKHAGEIALLSRTNTFFRPTVFRISSPYGPGMQTRSVLPLFVKRAREGQDVTWHGNGQRTQDFIFVDDVAGACLKAVETAQAGVFFLASGVPTSMLNLAKQAAALYPGIHAVPSNQPDPSENQQFEINVRALKEILDYHPKIQLADGLARFADSLRYPNACRNWWV